MYSLLVKYDGWKNMRGSMGFARVFEFTDDELANRLRPEGNLKVEAMRRIPVIFTSETGGTNPDDAQIGTIVSITTGSKEYQLEFSVDPKLPTIPIAKLMTLAEELQIHEWELSRTHWSVKNVDLFEILFKTEFEKPFYNPKVFTLDESIRIDNKLISVMMPFGKEFLEIYSSIQELASQKGLTCLRADDIWEHDHVIQDIVTLIARSGIVICDCTGRNPNVFYEIGIAHTLGREVILITQNKDDIPFDLRHIRFVEYLNNGEGIKLLATALNSRITTLLA